MRSALPSAIGLGRANRGLSPLWAGPLVALACVVAGAGFIWAADQWFQRQPKVVVSAIGQGEVLVMRSGRLDLAGLAEAADRAGRPGALRFTEPDVWSISTPVLVESGARLELRDATVRLVSTPGRVAWIHALGGQVLIEASSVTSWDPDRGRADTEVADGRSYIWASRGAWLDVVRSKLFRLGYRAGAESGLAWTESSGAITGSTISSSFTGALVSANRASVSVGRALPGLLLGPAGVRPAARSPAVSVQDSTFRLSARNGFQVEGTCALSVRGSTFSANGSNGLAVQGQGVALRLAGSRAFKNAASGFLVDGASDSTVIESNLAWGNVESGLALRNSGRVRLSANRAWSNTAGIEVIAPRRPTEVLDNVSSANRTDGLVLEVQRSALLARVGGNRLDHNGRSGVWMLGLPVAVERWNTLVENPVAVGRP